MGHVLVLGLGISGKAACELLHHKGYAVTAIDDQSHQSIDVDISAFDFVVPSPGISPRHPLYSQAIKKNIPLVGEAQLALRGLSQTVIGITGTNGKTTVTSLVSHVLNASGFSSRALGNIGDPLSLYAMKPDSNEILVVELSSYQLETMHGPILDSAVILNITPDHLDRYRSMQEYARSKWQIQHCLKETAPPLLVYRKVLEKWSQLSIDLCQIYDATSALIGLNCVGSHEWENASAAWLLVEKFGVTKEQFCKAYSTFKKPLHRIEYIETVDSVRFFDDSKGTNLDAVIRAVETMQGPVWLIAGGVDKGASYKIWKEPFDKKVRKIFAFGQAREKIALEAGEFCCVEVVETLQEAVTKAAKEAQRGGNVLLSPGCSSLDMFRDYAHRGEEFQRFVKILRERGTHES